MYWAARALGAFGIFLMFGIFPAFGVCPTPNPNLLGPPFVDGCSLPAAGLNLVRPSFPTKASAGYASLTTNPGTYTLSDTDRGLVIAGPDQGADGINAACKTAPVSPYSAIIHFYLGTLPGTAGANDSGGGFAWRDPASGKIITEYLLVNPTAGETRPTMYSIDFGTPTFTAGGSEGNVAILPVGVKVEGWQKIVDTGTQIQTLYSYDGTTWFPVFAAINYASDYFGIRPPQVCIFASGHGSATSITVDYYKETSP